MRLRLNTTLRAALIAAITAVGFTLPQSFAVDPVTILTLGVITTETPYEFITDSIAPNNTSSATCNLADGSTLQLTTTTKFWTSATDSALAGTWSNAAALSEMNNALGSTFDAADFSAGGNYTYTAPGNQNSVATLTLDDQLYTPDAYNITMYVTVASRGNTMNNFSVSGLTDATVSYATNDGNGFSSSAVYSSGGGAITMIKIEGTLNGSDIRMTSTTGRNGWQTISYVISAAPTRDEYTWDGTDGDNEWNYSSTNWTKGGASVGFVAGNDAVFDTNGYNQVSITSAVSARNVTVSDQNYTFNITGEGSLAMKSLTVAEDASLSVSGAGTVEVSEAVVVTGTNTLTIGEDATLKLTNADAAKALMKNSSVTNNGTFELGADVTIGTTADSSTIGGTLLIKGHTLSLGNAEGQEASIHSFSSIQLDNGTISFNNKQDNLQNLEVATGKTGVINSYDMGQGEAALVLGGTSNIAGTLTIQNEWNAQFDIKKLAGSGTLNIKGTNGAESSRQAAAYTIGSLEGGFTGTVNIINGSATVKLANGTKLGSMEIGPGSLLVDTGVTATIGNLKVRDNKAATITVNGTLNVESRFNTWSCGNTTTVTGADTGVMNVGNMDLSNIGTNMALKHITLTVAGAATAGDSDRGKNNTRIDMSEGSTLNLKGNVGFYTDANKYTDINLNKATLNVGDAAAEAATTNVFNAINIQAKGGTVLFQKSNNTVASLTEAVAEDGATVSVTVASDATLTINGGSLTSAITNAGTLTFGGNITATGFEVNKGTTGLVDVNGATDSGNGFETTSGDSITIANNGTGATLTPGGHKVTQDNVEYTIQADGTAVTAGSSTDYSTYYQTQGTVTTSAIAEAAAGHGIFMSAVVSGTGVLDVNSNLGFITANGGEVIFNGGASDMLIVNDSAKVSGLTDYSSMQIAAGKTATMKEGVTSGDVAFSATDGVQLTNTGNEATYYALNNADVKVTADTMTVDGTEDVEVYNSLVVDEIVNNTPGTLILYGNVEDGVTLNAVGGDIIMLGQTSNTVSVVDLNIAAGKMVELMDGESYEEGTVTVSGVLTGGSATLYANLIILGGEGSMLDVNGGGGAALTLGSELTVDTTNGLVNLDADTIAALSALSAGETLNLIVAAEQTTLDYSEAYNGMWYDAMFNRVDGLTGDYIVYAQGDAFGLTKFSNVPEPTTGTLSLLALAALAARRRRK